MKFVTERDVLQGVTVLQDVTVVDTLDGTRTAHQDVRLDGGTIRSVGATGQSHPDATVIDLEGCFVVPGYVDAHAHPLNNPSRVRGAYELMLANGIVGFRQMSGDDRLLADRAAGRLPTFTGAPELLATCGDVLTPLNAGTPYAARATVARQQRQGADFVKAAMTTRATHIAALEEARRVGIPVVGHLPNDVDPRLAAALGMRSIEHLGPGASVFEGAASPAGATSYDGTTSYEGATSYEATASSEGATSEPDAGRSTGADRSTGAAGPASDDPPSGPRVRNISVPGVDKLVARAIRNIVVNPATRTSPDAARRLAAADNAFDEELARNLARVFVENETWQTPTLIRMHTQQFPDAPEHAYDPNLRYMAPREVATWRKSTRRFLALPEPTRDVLRAHWEAQLRLTRIFDEEGVPLLAGTDSSGAGWVVPGFALHDEFDLLACAGLSPLHILQSTTIAPARFLGRTDVAGRVAPGLNADLVVLRGDPVVDHRNLHTIGGVVRAGRWWSRRDLDGILARAEAEPTAV